MTQSFSPNVDELVGYNAAQAEDFADAEMPAPPSRSLAVVTCMDARIDPLKMLGLRNGEAHTLRNAGGVITDDVIRSLCLSQRYLGTREIILVHHTKCGLEGVDETEFRDQLEQEIGLKPSWAVGGFADPVADVRESIQQLQSDPFLPHKDHISGFVYDVTDGLLYAV